jgi:hypothetical protein
MAIGRDAMTKELADRRKRVLKVKELMGSSGGGKGTSASMKMPSTAMPSTEMPTSDMSAAPAMKKGGRVVEKASKEVYSSKSAMKKHEKGESKATERKEDKMRGGGIAQKGKGVALKKGGLPNIGKVSGVTSKKPKMMIVIALGKGKKK